MALIPILPSEFTGWNKLSQKDHDEEELQAYIDKFYAKRVKQILGAYAYNDMMTNPITQKYTDIFTGKYYFDIACNKFLYPDGLTEAMLSLIYFDWIRDPFINAGNGIGNVNNLNENSTVLSGFDNSAIGKSRFNEASRIVEQACLFVANYSNFATDITSSVDNTGTYTINTASTLYLQDGDTVSINSTDYVVSSIVDNTSFVITEATAGLDFSSFQWVHSPYENTTVTLLGIII